MSFPRIIYHLNEGIKTDYGYCYKRCETAEQFAEDSKRGWKMTSQELFEPEPETVLDPVKDPDEKTDNADAKDKVDPVNTPAAGADDSGKADKKASKKASKKAAEA
jgi:hypothetical protein